MDKAKHSKLRNKFFTEAAAITVTNSPFNPKNATNKKRWGSESQGGIFWTYGYYYSVQSLHQLCVCLEYMLSFHIND